MLFVLRRKKKVQITAHQEIKIICSCKTSISVQTIGYYIRLTV